MAETRGWTRCLVVSINSPFCIRSVIDEAGSGSNRGMKGRINPEWLTFRDKMMDNGLGESGDGE
jgi:hypothetical protein